jgi:hypothetical protein
VPKPRAQAMPPPPPAQYERQSRTRNAYGAPYPTSPLGNRASSESLRSTGSAGPIRTSARGAAARVLEIRRELVLTREERLRIELAQAKQEAEESSWYEEHGLSDSDRR